MSSTHESDIETVPEEVHPVAAGSAALRLAAVALCLLLLAACTPAAPEKEPDPGPPPGGSHNLYLSVGTDDTTNPTTPGLYALDTDTGMATLISGQTISAAEGLAPGPNNLELFGAVRTELFIQSRTATNRRVLLEATPYTEGLAYDAEEDLLYTASNGYMYVRSAQTGEILETWYSPPNEYDFEGLAFDPVDRVLYGLVRGYPSQPQFTHDLQLYSFRVDDPQPPARVVVGNTGTHWAGAGLAFDLEQRVLYAVGNMNDEDGLYRIDPVTGATALIGSTGLPKASGGLAWLPSPPD